MSLRDDKVDELILSFFEFSPTLLAVYNENGKVLVCNKAWTEVFGDRSPSFKSLPSTLTRSDDSPQEMEWGHFPKGKLTFVMGRDVTGERSTQRFLENVLNNLPLALFAKDADNEFRFIQWSKKAESFFGLSREEVIGKNDFDFFPKEEAEHFRKMDEETLKRNGVLAIHEEPVTSPNQETRWVRTYKIGIKTKGDKANILLGLSEDVTELRKQNETVKAQQLQLIESARLSSLGEMASGIAHEINNPLAILKVRAESMARRGADQFDSPEKLSEEIKKMEATIDRIAKIVRGLSSFGRSGEQDPFIPTPLRTVLEEVLELCREKLKKQHIELRLKMEDDPIISCRSVQIIQVITNLLNNSFDALKDQKDAWIEIQVKESANSRVTLSITDSGKGIPPNIAQKMFNPFFSTKPAGKGTGLGLSISAGFIDAHEGTLSYDSKSPNTRFVIELPLSSHKKAA